VVQEVAADAPPTPIRMHNHILQPRGPASLNGADREEDRDHSDHSFGLSCAVDVADPRIVEDESQTAPLPLSVRSEVDFLREQLGEQRAKLGYVVADRLPDNRERRSIAS